jgi:hypothetical protein
MERVIRRFPLAVTILGLMCLGTTAPAGAPLISNGSFAEGAGGTPADWQTTAWTPGTARFAWEVAPDGTGTIGITNTEPNDARWCQKVSVQAGATYRVSAWVKTSEVGTITAGAHIAIEPRITDSPDVRGTHDWRSIEVVAKAGEESSWDVCGRLGSYANLNTGAAWFADFAMVQIGRAPARPSLAWRLWQDTRWTAIGLPLFGALLLALGLGISMGIGRSRATTDREPGGGSDGTEA